MENQRNSLLPETNNASPRMYYDDLKYPLEKRGIRIPVLMEEYIHQLTERDTISTEEIEAIRQEMVKVFEDARQPIPPTFDENFKKWFPWGTDGEDQTAETQRVAAETAESSNGGVPRLNTPQNNTPERESSVERSDTDLHRNPVERAAHPVQSSAYPVQSSVDTVQGSVASDGRHVVDNVPPVRENQHNDTPHTPSTRQPEIPSNPVPYLHPDLDAQARVCEYLQQVNGEHMASTGDIREALGLAKSTFKWVIDQLIAEGKVEKIGYGIYQLKSSV